MENYDKSNGNEKIIDLIRKCLALSKSSNEHEASLALAKAQELLKKYNLSMAEVSIEQNKTPDLIKGIVPYDERWQSTLIHGIAKLNSCRTIRLVSDSKVVVLGRVPNVMVTYELASWIMPQLVNISLEESSKHREYNYDPDTASISRATWTSKREWNKDFMMGITYRVISRLEELSKERQVDNPSLTALVVNLSAEAQAFLDKEYPHRVSGSYRHGYSEGYHLGTMAGGRVGLTAPSRHISRRQSLPEGRK